MGGLGHINVMIKPKYYYFMCIVQKTYGKKQKSPF